MIQSPPDTNSTITHTGNIVRINPALVEKTSAPGSSFPYLLVSYTVSELNGTSATALRRLNIGENTLIINTFGMQLRFEDIRVGAWIDARLSSAMTRSIPPQSEAYLIINQRNPHPAKSVTTTGRVASVDTGNNLLYTGNPRNIESQTKYVITATTTITNRYGHPIPLSAIQPGETVLINHANFQTASIPPQATAFSIQQL